VYDELWYNSMIMNSIVCVLGNSWLLLLLTQSFVPVVFYFGWQARKEGAMPHPGPQLNRHWYETVVATCQAQYNLHQVLVLVPVAEAVAARLTELCVVRPVVCNSPTPRHREVCLLSVLRNECSLLRKTEVMHCRFICEICRLCWCCWVWDTRVFV